MLKDFLSACRCVLPDERNDLGGVLRRMPEGPVSVGFMPAIADDLYPVYALSCTSASRIVSPSVYIVPVGAMNGWAKPQLEQLVDRFYSDDELGFRQSFDFELEETLLLENPGVDGFFLLNGRERYNVLFCRVTAPGGREVVLCVVPSSPEACWKQIIEPCGIACDVLIDSHKGLGGWLDDSPLFAAMRETAFPELLPRYYFKGRFISHEPPQGFSLFYRIPEPILSHGQPVSESGKSIYSIDWTHSD